MFSLAKIRAQSRNEELWNGISHGLVFVAAALATPLFVIQAIDKGDARYVVGVSVFCATIMLLYLSSTMYHLFARGKTKNLFYVFDTSAIFMLIAGSYTPFLLGALNGALGWSLFGTIWGAAVIGILLKLAYKNRHPRVATTLYVIMGWVVILAIKPMIAVIPLAGILWLAAGGASYSIGVVFFIYDSRIKYGHSIWHLFVTVGTVCHCIAVYYYAA